MIALTQGWGSGLGPGAGARGWSPGAGARDWGPGLEPGGWGPGLGAGLGRSYRRGVTSSSCTLGSGTTVSALDTGRIDCSAPPFPLPMRTRPA